MIIKFSYVFDESSNSFTPNMLLPTGQTVTGDHYNQQLHVHQALKEKRSQIATNRCKVILLLDNARPHVIVAIKET